jgi:uncharacterized RDD family membrane protein YckC
MLSAVADRRKPLMTTGNSDTDIPAALWRRLAGLVYDLVVVVAIVMVVGMLCQIATGGQLIGTGARTVVPWWYPLLQCAVVAAYFVVSWLRGGQTLGMRPWQMRLRMRDGGPVRWPAALVRAAVALSPLLLLGFGRFTTTRTALLLPLAAWAVFFAVALFDRRRRALHDIVAGTALTIFAPPRPTDASASPDM